jgi:hypothetical protein
MPENSCFEITLDVNRCKREEISVELLDNLIVVHTRKCQEGDNSIVARKFSKRMYPIDLDKFDKDSLKYEIDAGGMLKIQLFPKQD